MNEMGHTWNVKVVTNISVVLYLTFNYRNSSKSCWPQFMSSEVDVTYLPKAMQRQSEIITFFFFQNVFGLGNKHQHKLNCKVVTELQCLLVWTFVSKPHCESGSSCRITARATIPDVQNHNLLKNRLSACFLVDSDVASVFWLAFRAHSFSRRTTK